MRLGCCYYPEHWSEDYWAEDARRMVEMGLSRVRIGEFAWSRLEPEPGRYDLDWLDRAVKVLHEAGLGIIMGTPTATPPKWLVDSMSDMLAYDGNGQPRGFGSRRHYCFSHEGYAKECDRIVSVLADRYGDHPAIVAWQTDNEYGCHDTAVSYSPAARDSFRLWLAAKYADVRELNAAWGNVFWSMEYRSFNDIELPNLAVTEANPAHWLDFRRFSSDQVGRFNRRQTDILRAASPGRDIVHNFMGFFTQFDHHAVGRDLDVVSWDSYPLGFLEQFWFSEEEKQSYCRQGHPDIAAFHHDLYRGCQEQGRWWVMEQQPGPVNWARFNPAPLPGMVRLWTLEAMAHGAELVSYFRWRQAPFAQEQMHAGLLRPDCADDQGAIEARQAAKDIAAIGDVGPPPRSVALLFDYQSDWVTDIQPQGKGFSALRATFEYYTALRKLGLDIDILSPAASLDGYAMVVIPCMPIMPADLVARLAVFAGTVLIGPRSGSKTENFAIPPRLAPGPLQNLLPLKIVRVESLRNGIKFEGDGFAISRWIETVETSLEPQIAMADGRGILYRAANIHYLAGWPDSRLLQIVIGHLSLESEIPVTPLPEAVRVRRAGNICFAFNYGTAAAQLPEDQEHNFLSGGRDIPSAGVAIWQRD